MSAGTPCKTGASLSSTVTLKLGLAVFPLLSADVQVTVVSPSGKVEPEAGAQLTGRGPSTASVAAGLNVTAAPPGPVALAVIGPLGKPLITGAVVSRTVTLKVLPVELPRLSADVQVTVVSPSGKVESEACAQSTGRGPSTASVAVGLV